VEISLAECQMLTGCPRTPGEHKVHPYLRPETLCRGESCIRPYTAFRWSLLFSDSLLRRDPLNRHRARIPKKNTRRGMGYLVVKSCHFLAKYFLPQRAQRSQREDFFLNSVSSVAEITFSVPALGRGAVRYFISWTPGR
jgi:hypothetical protein